MKCAVRGSFRLHRQLIVLRGSGPWLLCAILWITTGLVPQAHAADYADLAVVKPVVPCEQLALADVKTPDGTPITIRSATVRQTEKGYYCTVTASVAPHYSFQANLPIEHWTQRFVMGGFGQAGGCTPAMNGEFVAGTVGAGTGGNAGAGGNVEDTSRDPLAATWGVPPQARIDSAYMNNHMAALGLKATIKAFYGQGPRYSYMTGCSAPGLQVLKEAQRFPEDFDGYSIGAPPLYQTTHDLGFWHGLEPRTNRRADGSIVLTADKLPILHAAALDHCAAISGIIDGDLQQPTACTFDRAWVLCVAGTTDTSKCLTAEEANVAEQLYLGPNDGKGHFFEPGGYVPGSELLWKLSTPDKVSDGEALAPHGVHSFLMPPLSGQETSTIMAQFSFSQEWFDKTREMWGLFNAGNTDLSKLARLGGKIILWNGAEDTTVQPATALSYYEAVQKQMGVRQTDAFLRFFLLPGVGHCGMGDSANQVDILTPLMAWVEMHKTPEVIVAGKPVPQTEAPGQGGRGGQNVAGGQGMRPGGGSPYAQAARPTVYTRPIYPYPNVARYKGTGDPNDAASYVEVRGAAKYPQPFHNESATLLGPSVDRFYKVVDGQLVMP